MADAKPAINDAILTYADAEVWVRELYKVKPSDLCHQMVQIEPALVGVMIDLSRRARGAMWPIDHSDETAEVAAQAAIRAGIIGAELMRRAYRKFNDEEDSK